MLSINTRKTGVRIAWLSAVFFATWASGQTTGSADREIYAVEVGRDSLGRLFFAPTDSPGRADAGPVYTITGNILSKASSRSVQMLFEVTTESGELVHSLDLAKEAESGATPFGFEWPIAEVADGDYRVCIQLMDPVLGEEARLERRVMLRNRAVVSNEVERARGLLTQLRDAYPELPAYAAHPLRLALEALAPYPSADRPLVEADLNARYARSVAGSVRARLALTSANPSTESVAASPNSGFTGAMRAGIVLSPASSPDRLAELGFTFAPYVINPAGNSMPHTAIATTDIPRMVWIAGAEEIAQVPSPGSLANAMTLGHVAGVSLWTAPRIAMQGEAVQREFRDYVRGLYADRHALNQAWKQHYFDFSEVQFLAFSDSRAYQFDAQSFRRTRTTQWLTDQMRAAAPAISPAAPTLTFTEGILLPGESRAGLDVETLAALLPLVSVRTAGPFDDARYGQRFPAAQLVWAMMHSFAPDRPIVALHSLDYSLEDRVRLDSAAHARMLTIEAALENVAALGVEFPALEDPVAQAPEAVAGIAQALRDLDGATEALHALRDAVAPIAIVWSDSSRVLDDGVRHLGAFARAYEGCAFSGYKVSILTERQLSEGRWRGVQVVVLPEVTALGREAFAGLESLIDGGAVVVRTEFGPTYDERGNALGVTLPVNSKTMLVRGNGSPREFLSALDALQARGILEDIPRPITRDRYPIEGVKTRYAESGAGRFLYVVNLRKEPVSCRFSLPVEGATDLLSGRTVDFPRQLDPLAPMLLRLSGAIDTD